MAPAYVWAAVQDIYIRNKKTSIKYEGVRERWTQGDRTLDQASGLVQDPKVEVLLLYCGELEGSSSE